MKDEKLTPFEMENELNNIGYDREYLETLSSSQIERLYNEDVLGIEEE